MLPDARRGRLRRLRICPTLNPSRASASRICPCGNGFLFMRKWISVHAETDFCSCGNRFLFMRTQISVHVQRGFCSCGERFDLNEAPHLPDPEAVARVQNLAMRKHVSFKVAGGTVPPLQPLLPLRNSLFPKVNKGLTFALTRPAPARPESVPGINIPLQV